VTLLGPKALTLRARALPAAAAPDRLARADQAAACVWIAFRPAGLAAPERERLRRIGSARFSAFLPPGVAPGGEPGEPEGLFACGREELERAAGELEAARVFLAAADALARAPAEPALMGVVNVTPDSFSDGGLYLDPARAVEHGLRLEAEGAAILDVGGESTRPGAESVPAATELGRVLPVVAGLARASRARISIDTSKAEVARAALDAGATMVNDVSAGRADPALLPLVAEHGCDYVLMHMQGHPRSMQADPRYRDPVAEVCDFLRERAAACLNAGIEAQRLVVDPGIGFGKRLVHNLELLRRLPELRSLGRPVCVGVSRKSFIAHATGRLRPEDWVRNRPGNGVEDRAGGSAAAVAICVLGGAEILRVHDVARMAEAAAVARGVARPERFASDSSSRPGKGG